MYVCSRKQQSNDFHVIFLDFLLALKKYNSIKLDFGYYVQRNFVGKERFKAPFIVDVSFPYSNILTEITPGEFERLAVSYTLVIIYILYIYMYTSIVAS